MTRKFTYGREFNISEAKNLIELIIRLDNWEKVRLLLLDLLSPQELEEINRRLEASLMLLKGNTYQQICEKLGMSEATVQKVHNKLKYGSKGYILAAELLGRIKSKERKLADRYLHPTDRYIKSRIAKGK